MTNIFKWEFNSIPEGVLGMQCQHYKKLTYSGKMRQSQKNSLWMLSWSYSIKLTLRIFRKWNDGLWHPLAIFTKIRWQYFLPARY